MTDNLEFRTFIKTNSLEYILKIFNSNDLMIVQSDREWSDKEEKEDAFSEIAPLYAKIEKKGYMKANIKYDRKRYGQFDSEEILDFLEREKIGDMAVGRLSLRIKNKELLKYMKKEDRKYVEYFKAHFFRYGYNSEEGWTQSNETYTGPDRINKDKILKYGFKRMVLRLEALEACSRYGNTNISDENILDRYTYGRIKKALDFTPNSLKFESQGEIFMTLPIYQAQYRLDKTLGWVYVGGGE